MIKEFLTDEDTRESSAMIGCILPIIAFFMLGMFGSNLDGMLIVGFIIFVGLASALTGVFGNYLYYKYQSTNSKKSAFLHVFEDMPSYQGLLINFIVIAFLMEITLHSFNGIAIAILGFVAMEIIFWFFLYEKPKPGENKYTFALVQKLYALFIGGGLIGAFITIYNTVRCLMIHGQKTLATLIIIGQTIAILVIVIGGIWLFIWSNTLKYKDVPNEKPIEQLIKVVKQARKIQQKKKTTIKKVVVKKQTKKKTTKVKQSGRKTRSTKKSTKRK